MKRTDYISWDEFFMGCAIVASMRSKDPNTQVGCCIASKDNRVLSIGYNGFPNGLSDDIYPWERNGDFTETKYAYVVHSELNAILNTKSDLHNSVLYVTLFPCHECAKAIVQAGIKEVIYYDDKYNGTNSNIVAKKIFDSAGVTYRMYKPSKQINIDL